MYDFKIYKSYKTDIPTIGIGNLTVGGSGKTPHTEYCLNLLNKEKIKAATLSRGYGRKTKGFAEVSADSNHFSVGDEPKQIKTKFPHNHIFICENRVKGLRQIRKLYPEIKVVILDDVFQHRAIQPTVNILLMEYKGVNKRDFLLPMGKLREPFSQKKRADAIVITKCPEMLSPIEKRIIKQNLKLMPYQKIFFSYIKYKDITPIYSHDSEMMFGKEYYAEQGYSVLLLTGIASTEALKEHLIKEFKNIKELTFGDHHEYSYADLIKIKSEFNAIESDKKLIFTTEKDAARLQFDAAKKELKSLPIFSIGIEVVFHKEEELTFNQFILKNVR